MAGPAPYAQQTDETLMLAAGTGDAEAFGQLYDRYATVALRVARSVCRDAGRAEDAVQEGFLSMWRARARYRPESGSVRGWALSIVRHRAIDSVRRDAADTRATLVELPAPLADTDSPSPADTAIERSEAEALHAFLNQLPDAQAEVIALAFFGGLTHAEIATQLALPPGTVKGRMRLGMHKLRADMEDREALPQGRR